MGHQIPVVQAVPTTVTDTHNNNTVQWVSLSTPQVTGVANSELNSFYRLIFINFNIYQLLLINSISICIYWSVFRILHLKTSIIFCFVNLMLPFRPILSYFYSNSKYSKINNKFQSFIITSCIIVQYRNSFHHA